MHYFIGYQSEPKKSYSSEGWKATKIILSEQHTYLIFMQLVPIGIKYFNNV